MLIFHEALSVYSGLHRKLNIWQALFGFFSGIICQDMSCHLITHSHSTTHFPFLVWVLKAFKRSFKKKSSDLQKSFVSLLGDSVKGQAMWTPRPGSWYLYPIKVTCVLETYVMIDPPTTEKGEWWELLGPNFYVSAPTVNEHLSVEQCSYKYSPLGEVRTNSSVSLSFGSDMQMTHNFIFSFILMTTSHCLIIYKINY